MAPVPAALSLSGFSTNKVRGPGAAAAGTCSVKCKIPRPRGSRLLTVISGVGGPLIVYVKDGSRALTEKTHRSAVPVPVAGRWMITRLSPRTQDAVAHE